MTRSKRRSAWRWKARHRPKATRPPSPKRCSKAAMTTISTACATWRAARRWCAPSPSCSSAPSSCAPPTSTSSRSAARCRCGCASTACCATIPPPPPDMARAIVSRVKILAGLNIAERRLPQDGRARVSVAAIELDLRVATMPTRTANRRSCACWSATSACSTSSARARPARPQVSSSIISNSPHGLIIVTGPTGSGKTTTLASALSRLNAPLPQDPHHRGSDRVRNPGREPDAGEAGDRADLRHRAALLPAPGSGRDHGRRNARRRDRQDRHPGLAHRPSRADHAAHQHRRRGGHPPRSTWASSRSCWPRRCAASSASGWCACSVPTAAR